MKLNRALVTGIFLTATLAMAQSNDPAINQRRVNQQDRIANGVQSGQLTAGETKSVEGQEAGINQEIRSDRQANGGTLTPQEKQQVNQQQNGVSKQIYSDKHNAAKAGYGNNEVGQRRENQQDRIAQGVRSGNLSAGQTARLETREQGINKTIKSDRQANGGKLTGQERRQVNRAQNRVSRSIYRDKRR
jgi:hypothetical protein